MSLNDLIGDEVALSADQSVASDFLCKFTNWLSEDYEKWKEHREPGLHASSLWKTCVRQRLLTKIHNPKPLPMAAGNYLTFDVGHALHHWWQNKYLGPMGILLGEWFCRRCNKIVNDGTKPEACYECKSRSSIEYKEYRVVNKEVGYVGSCDGVLQMDNKKYVFEFKTASASDFPGITKPKSEHVVQAHAYMCGLKIDEALIVYQNKGKQCDWTKRNGQFVPGKPQIKAFHVTFDKDRWASFVARANDWHSVDALINDPPEKLAGYVAQFERLCTSKTCALAESCLVVDQCFAAPAKQSSK